MSIAITPHQVERRSGSAAGSIRTIDSSFRRFGHWTIAMTEPSAISLRSPLAN
jgi:hypothetical protein